MKDTTYTKEDLKPKLNLVAENAFENGIFKNEESPYFRKSKLYFIGKTFIRKYSFLNSVMYTYINRVKKSIKKSLKEKKGRSSEALLKAGYKQLKLESGVDLLIHPDSPDLPSEKNIMLLNTALNTIPCPHLNKILCEKGENGGDAYVHLGDDTIFIVGTSFKDLSIPTILHEMTHLNQYQKHGRQIAVSHTIGESGHMYFPISRGKHFGYFFKSAIMYRLLPFEFQANCPVSNGLLEVNKILFRQGIFITGIGGLGLKEIIFYKDLGEEQKITQFNMDNNHFIKNRSSTIIYSMEFLKTQLYLAYDYFKEVDEEFLNQIIVITMDAERHIKEVLEI